MIGMVNVPCDSPIDFYAAAPNHSDSRNYSDEVPKTPTRRTPSYRPLFMNHRKTIEYAVDGRKISDGVMMEVFTIKDLEEFNGWDEDDDGPAPALNLLPLHLVKSEPNKLWEELILRSFVNRFEEEIQSPVESYKTLESELAKLNVKVPDKSLYRSTYSLVSPNRVEASEMTLNDMKERKRSFTAELPLIPFIKSIKGKKKPVKPK